MLLVFSLQNDVKWDMHFTLMKLVKTDMMRNPKLEVSLLWSSLLLVSNNWLHKLGNCDNQIEAENLLHV